MADIHVLVTVAIIWSVAAITPGPNFFITVHNALGGRKSNAIFTVLGIVFGTFIWSLAGYMGVTVVFKLVPMLYYALKIIGGLYLIYTGINLLFSKRSLSKNRQGNKEVSAYTCFRMGLLTNLLNPKTAAFMTSLFAATIPTDASLQLGGLSVLVICSISGLWYSTVAQVFYFKAMRDMYRNWQRVFERVAGTVFIFFGVKLALSK